MRRDAEQQRALEQELQREMERQQERESRLEQLREDERLRTLELEKLEQERVREVEAYNSQYAAYPHYETGLGAGSAVPEETLPPTPLSPVMEDSAEARFEDSCYHSRNESSLSILKQSIKMSLDKAKTLYKTSTQALGRSTPALSLAADEQDAGSKRSMSDMDSLEERKDESQEPEADLPLFPGSDAAHDQDNASENRMTLWIRSVEKVVEDARQNFAASTNDMPLSPLPAPRPPARISADSRPQRYSAGDKEEKLQEQSQDNSQLLSPTASSDNGKSSRRASRVARKILPASQIFPEGYESFLSISTPEPSLSTDDNSRSLLSASTSVRALPPSPSPFKVDPDSPTGQSPAAIPRCKSFSDNTLPTIPSEVIDAVLSPAAATPPRTRPRRTTIVTRSPEATRKERPSLSIEVPNENSPSKHREKSRSQNDLGGHLGRPITPVSKLEFELKRLENPEPKPAPRLSALVGKDALKRDPAVKKSMNERLTPITKNDDLTSSPLHVEPYPPRPVSQIALSMDSPAKRHVENVYDRFLMSTTGVKRVGKGYQSDNKGPVSNKAQPKVSTYKRGPTLFHSTRKPMPPPVSSEDVYRRSSTGDVDEFGVVTCGQSSVALQEASNTVGTVRRAFKTLMTGKR
ncbi:hypothetical protein NM688_g7927 [Phlebia brevispora]|uniref:Uncharacterized protein n=1 Tax=Phlebia brevispora TaxID=194682 RepID=A0ACC1RZH9_9APHY|nr:hypothetical protein NM688_g7927 [Phlebia brevispora]